MTLAISSIVKCSAKKSDCNEELDVNFQGFENERTRSNDLSTSHITKWWLNMLSYFFIMDH